MQDISKRRNSSAGRGQKMPGASSKKTSRNSERLRAERQAKSQKQPVEQRGKVDVELGTFSLLNVAIIGLVVLLFTGGGVGAWMYFSSGTTAKAAKTTTLPHTPFTTKATTTGKTTTTPAPFTGKPVVLKVDQEWKKIRGNCGIPKQRPHLGRIVGGTEAVKHSWPWQIGLLRYKQFSPGRASKSHTCGGTLVGPKYVITATHCFLNNRMDAVSKDPNGYRVLVGAHKKGKISGGARILEIKNILHHPRNNLEVFNRLSVTPDYDITILMLKVAVNPNVPSPVAGFACLPPLNARPPARAMCWTSGWGATGGTGFDRVLKQVAVPIVSHYECYKRYGKRGLKEILHLCGGPHKGSQGTCQGDSGGPLVCQYEDGSWVLHGDTSFGPQPCGTAPAVWAHLSAHMEWICCHLVNYGPCRKIKCKRL